MEESYESFAGVYDLFMDNIDYPAWCTYLTGILKEYGIEDGLIAGAWLRYRKYDRTSGS